MIDQPVGLRETTPSTSEQHHGLHLPYTSNHHGGALISEDHLDDVRTSLVNGHNFSAAYNRRIDAGTRGSGGDEDALAEEDAQSRQIVDHREQTK